MIQNTLRCNENNWILSQNYDLQLESPPLINSKAVLYSGDFVCGMLHVSNKHGLNKIDTFLNEIKKSDSDIKSSNFKIAMKTIDTNPETDEFLLEISKKFDIPINKIYNQIITMDSKKIVSIKRKDKEKIIEMY